VVAQDGDYFGRTINLAARVAAHAGAGHVLVSGSVAESALPQGLRFVEASEVRLKGFARPARLLAAGQPQPSVTTSYTGGDLSHPTCRSARRWSTARPSTPSLRWEAGKENA
jgi:hypothetical protein